MIPPFWCSTAVLVALAAPLVSPAAEDAEARRVKDALAGLEEHFSHLRGQYVIEGKLVDHSFSYEPISSRMVLKRRGEWLCLEQYFLSKDEDTGIAWVICRGPEQSFLLRRQRGGPFVVAAVSSRGDDDYEDSTTFLQMDYYVQTLCEGVSGIRGDLARAAKASSLVVESVRTPPDRGGVVEVDYRVDGGGPRESHRGSIALDPAKRWAVVAHDLEQAHPDTPIDAAKAAYTYREVDGRLYPSSTSVDLYEGQRINRSLKFEIDRIEPRPVSDEEFRMTTYGIPAVAVAAPARPGLLSPTGWPFWALLAAAVTAFIAARAIRLRRAG